MHNDQVLDWLLEPDDPSTRYWALRTLFERSEDDTQVIAARRAILDFAPVRAILDAQYPAGYWIKPDRGYSPRHKATVWQLVFLADLGTPHTKAVARACQHVLAHAFRHDLGLFSAHQHSTGVYPCLNGDLLRALAHFDYGDHPVVQTAAQSLSQQIITGGFDCPRNSIQTGDKATWQPCVWGCIKVLRGLAAFSSEKHGPAVKQAAEKGVSFLLQRNLTQDQRPALAETDSYWLHFGFPLGYGSDLLEGALALTEWGVTEELGEAWELILSRQDEKGRWPLEHALSGSWADFGLEGQPNKGVTLRALHVLSRR